MSEPPNPSLNPHHSAAHHHRLPPPAALPSAAANPPSPTSPSSLSRDYRKGNWTVHETLILITAKRLNDERRSSSRSTSSSSTSPPLPLDSKPPNAGGVPQQCRSAELRWKWVENYCWRNGCLRSQNQCNDKWDNLLRDYKKVRDYDARAAADRSPSYWSLEKHERKDRNLPSNLSSEVFHALTDVLSRRNAHKAAAAAAAAAAAPPALAAAPRPPPSAALLLPPPHLQHPLQPVAQKPPSPVAEPQLPTEPVSLVPPPLPPPADTGAETSGKSESPEEDRGGEKGGEPNAKRRKKARDLGASVARGASVLARTLLACEEMREKRHRDLVELESRRLRMEEDRTEMSRQGIAGLIAAVNGLSGAVHALVSDRQLHHRRRNDEC